MPITDYYKQCEDGWRAILQAQTSFFSLPKFVSNGDDATLEAGGTYFATLHPGAIPDTSNAAQTVLTIWEIDCDIYVKFTKLQETWDRFRAMRAMIFQEAISHPSLSSTPGVDAVTISAKGKPAYIQDEKEEVVFFITQTITLQVLQRIGVTGGEYA